MPPAFTFAARLRVESGASLPYLVWVFDEPMCMVSTASVGGGFGERRWIVNAQVADGYARTDLAAHVGELLEHADLGHHDTGREHQGIGLLTAADVDAVEHRVDDGVEVWATTGIRIPTWAAAAPDANDPHPRAGIGTINIVAVLPESVHSGAMVNLVATVAEAKAQALIELGVPGTGTATDAVVVAAPIEPPSRSSDHDGATARSVFGGPRSHWGSRVARATHGAVRAGALDSISRLHAAGVDWS